MIRPGHAGWSVLVFIVATLAGSRADDASPSLADLEAYRQALAMPLRGDEPLVSFRDLWDRPRDFVGRSVAIEGRVARLFRQPGVGDFPPLVEGWVVSTSGDPFCLVFPPSEGGNVPGIGTQVRFAGQFVKRIEYRGSDVARVAPLIVGPRAPSPLQTWSAESSFHWSVANGMMVLGAALVVGLVLSRRFAARSFRTVRSIEPPPVFIDGDPGPEREPHDDV